MAERESSGAFDPRETYVHLTADDRGAPVPVDAGFWARIEERTELHEGRLVMASDIAEAMAHWERHPAGEELLVALSGAFEVVLEGPDGAERRVALAEGRAFLVPPGVWHRFEVDTPGRVLFVTPGKGTEHKPA